MSPVRILFAHGGLERGGAERVLRTLLGSIDRRVIEPAVAVAGDGPFIDELRDLDIPLVRVPAPGRLRTPRHIPGMVGSLTDAIRGTRARAVVAVGEKMALYTGWAARRARAACVFWLHDAPGGSAGAWLTQAALAVTPGAVAVAPSAWMARAFRRRFGLRTVAIPNGIDLAELDAASRDAARVRAASAWPPGAVVAAHVARLQRWKGAEVFLRAAVRLKGTPEPPLQFLVVGGALFGREEAYAASLPARAAAMGLDGQVHFTGHRNDATTLMAASDIIVHCSITPEPFALVVAEGMALGRAVIATRTRGPEEIVEHDRTGLLLPPGDDGALARALAALAADPARRRALGHAARAAAREQFSAARMARPFEELLRRIAR